MQYRLVLVLVLMSAVSATAQIPAKKKNNFRIAVLGCHKQFEPAPALANYLNIEPDLCLWIGDNVYADAPTNPSFIQTCYDALEAKPAFKKLIKDFDYMATWDDHDFGLNNAGKEYPFKKESKALFREFWNLEQAIPAEQDGIYYSRTINLRGKKLQVIMLDCRYNRDAPNGSGDVLGEAQWQWLAQELRQPADLRLLVSGFQILLDKDSGSETWDNFPTARQRLFETVRMAQAENVIFLTGDQHYGEVCRLRNALDFDAIELQFAGINQIEDPEFNPLRVSPVIQSKHSVAVIDIQIDSTKEDVPHLLFQIADAMSNQMELTYRVNLAEIGLELHFTEPTNFAKQQEVVLEHIYPDLEVRYTLDGTNPTANSKRYTSPFTIEETTTVKAKLFTKAQQARSTTFEKTYQKLSPKPALKSPGQLTEGLQYKYYEGRFDRLPDFAKLTPKKTGFTKNFALETLAEQEDYYAFVFEGLVNIPITGVYHFFTISDDGSKLYIDNQVVVDNDGSHSERRRTGLVALEKGFHPIRIEYFEDYDGQTLHIGYQDASGQIYNLSEKDLFYKKKISKK